MQPEDLSLVFGKRGLFIRIDAQYEILALKRLYLEYGIGLNGEEFNPLHIESIVLERFDRQTMQASQFAKTGEFAVWFHDLHFQYISRIVPPISDCGKRGSARMMYLCEGEIGS